MSFIKENFMLYNKTAYKLFYEYAKDLPIIDYHCHLNPAQIADNANFKSVTELMLGGDHYKWRAMRAVGIDEKYITGDADDKDKFRMWAKTVSYAIGNPLYHWTHLELNRYFSITEPLTERSADSIFDRCNEMLSSDEFKPRQLILRSNVETVCTTDSSFDDLANHKMLAQECKAFKVLPTFRPDAVIEINLPAFKKQMADAKITSYNDFLSVLSDRIEFFHKNGCRLADHGMGYIPYASGNAEIVFDKVMDGQHISHQEEDIYKTAVTSHCVREYYKHGWTLQIHTGALRNNNSRMFAKLGADSGYDSINDLCVAQNLSKLLDSFESEGYLPKTILYNLNPKDNYVLAAMAGNFQSAPYFGKIQFGSGWWFNDQRDGMENQLKSLASIGVLSTFVGMLTDSRSLISYPRHEYFRRILCNLLGTWVENGEYPDDMQMLGKIVQKISYYNAKDYFGF